MQARVPTPVGVLLVEGDESAVTSVRFDPPDAPAPKPPPAPGGAVARLAVELAEYFAGRRRDFTAPVAPAGTEFQRRVWSELAQVPFGARVSYADLARRVGGPTFTRAVGLANGANPLAIVRPCHRVIGANGDLVGYAGGLPRKRWLLAFEARVVSGARALEDYA